MPPISRAAVPAKNRTQAPEVKQVPQAKAAVNQQVAAGMDAVGPALALDQPNQSPVQREILTTKTTPRYPDIL